jgi:hypothetical protein
MQELSVVYDLVWRETIVVNLPEKVGVTYMATLEIDANDAVLANGNQTDSISV